MVRTGNELISKGNKMKTKEQILKEFIATITLEDTQTSLILEVLIDIRDIFKKLSEEE